MCESLSQLFLQVLTRRDGNSCYMCFGVEWMELLVDEPAGQTQQVGHRWSISTGRAFRVKFHALFAAAAVAGGINQRVVTLGVRSSQSVAGHWTARNSDQTLKHFRLCSQVSATQSHRWPWRWRWFWTRKKSGGTWRVAWRFHRVCRIGPWCGCSSRRAYAAGSAGAATRRSTCNEGSTEPPSNWSRRWRREPTWRPSTCPSPTCRCRCRCPHRELSPRPSFPVRTFSWFVLIQFNWQQPF